MNTQTWNLRHTTLDGVIARDAIYEGAAHDEALSRLLFVIEQNRRCGVLFGPPGAGKSLLMRKLGNIVRRSPREWAAVDVHGRNTGEILWELCGGLGLSPRYGDGPFVLWRRIQDRLLANHRAEFPAVVMLDHADQGGSEADALIARMIHLARQQRGLTLILSVRGRHISELPAAFHEATDLRIELGWLDRQQTGEFVRTIFQTADDEGPTFGEGAIDQLYVLSEGSPRVLTRLCDLAVLASVASNAATINEDTVRTAAADLQIAGGEAYRTSMSMSSTYPDHDRFDRDHL